MVVHSGDLDQAQILGIIFSVSIVLAAIGPLFLAIIFSSSSTAPTVPSQALNVPSIVPKTASPIVDLSFPGFAFEQNSFYVFAFNETGSPNTFSQHLISSVLNRTGGAPILRVGGTSGDFARYNGSQKDYSIPPALQQPPYIHKPYLSIGPSFFKAFQSFPGARYIFQVPLAMDDLKETLQWTKLGLDHIGADNLESLEIGNEPNFYKHYSLADYVEQHNTFATALSKNYSRLAGAPIYQALDIAWGGGSRNNIQRAFDAGIDRNKNIKTVAYHMYQGLNHNDGLSGLQRRIADHTKIVNALAIFGRFARYLQTTHPHIPIVLDEVGNSLSRQSGLNQRNNLATCLWNIDMQLQSMAIGVRRVNMQQMLFEGYSMWTPIASYATDANEPTLSSNSIAQLRNTTKVRRSARNAVGHRAYQRPHSQGKGTQAGKLIPAQVRANYYSQPFVADFIGSSNATRVHEIRTRSPEYLAANAAYDHDILSRISLINFHLWDKADTGGDRPVANITFSGLQKGRSVRVDVLSAEEGTYATSTLMYKGLQWTYESDGIERMVGNDSAIVEVSKVGTMSVELAATSAVMLILL